MKDIHSKYEKITTNQSKLKSYDQRISYLKALKKSIESNANKIVDALYKDIGKSEFESYISEIDFTIHEINKSIKSLKKWMKPTRVKSGLSFFPVKSHIYSEPYGSVLIIGPWNYPFQLIMAPLVGAIAAGNTAIVKPSELSSETARVISELLIGELAECVECVQGAVEETTQLLDLKFDYIFYTGNGSVGRIVMAKASKNLTPVTLELGGKSPCFVYTTEIDLSAKRIVWGKFFNAGQTCVAPDYILIANKNKKIFVESLKKWITYFYTKDVKNSKDYGRIINERHFSRLTSYLDDCEILYGGEVDKDQKYISPTIIEVTSNSKIMKDEIFGPILPILTFDTFEESVRFVKSGQKPLASYGFFDSNEQKNIFTSEISSGGMVINDCLIHLSNDSLPFGGVGESGMGSYHGKHSFDLFSHKKSVMSRSFFLENSLRYPPYKDKLSLIRFILKWLG